MMRTIWIDHKMNEAVLDEVNERRIMIITIMKRKIRLMGYLLRHNEFITNKIKGKINGRRPGERSCKFFFEEIL